MSIEKRERDLLSCLDHGDSVLCLGSPDMLSGYDLSQLCMREVGLTYPLGVSGQVGLTIKHMPNQQVTANLPQLRLINRTNSHAML